MKSELVRLYVEERLSLTKVANRSGISISSARKYILAAGVKLRSKTDGVRLVASDLSAIRLGKKRGPISEETRQKLKQAKTEWGKKYSKGVSLNSRGYFVFTRGRHKGRLVHRIVMEIKIGRDLLKNEDVHHIDGNKINNDPSNLMVISRSDHARLHRIADLHQKSRSKMTGRFLKRNEKC